MRILIAAAAIAALAACTQETTTETTPDSAEIVTPAPAPSPVPTTIVVTESDARTRLEADGYTNVTGLMQNPDGTWSATGTRNGAATQVTIGDSGVQVMTTPAPTTP
ncbi:MAG: hypothetical protein H7124_18230 [Phycisphaerales bacterium]|nr:hypothetical protein [Hyphomonadaceae bacterium]